MKEKNKGAQFHWVIGEDLKISEMVFKLQFKDQEVNQVNREIERKAESLPCVMSPGWERA